MWFCGFGDPADILTCHARSQEIRTIQDSVNAGRPCLQALLGAAHFVLAYKPTDDDHVFVYNNMDGELADHTKLQLSILFGSEVRPVTVRYPVVHKQTPGSMQCGPLVCSFMAKIVQGKMPDNVVFCNAEDQRTWLYDTLDVGNFSVCTKRGQGRRPKDALTLPRNDTIITVQEAKRLRTALSSGVNRRISIVKQKP